MSRVEVEVMGHRVVLRPWTYGQKQEALRKATKWVRDPRNPSRMVPEIDPWTLNDEMIVATVVEWDLKDEEGRPLPITVEALHSIRPPRLVEAILSEVQRVNDLTEEERKKS